MESRLSIEVDVPKAIRTQQCVECEGVAVLVSLNEDGPHSYAYLHNGMPHVQYRGRMVCECGWATVRHMGRHFANEKAVRWYGAGARVDRVVTEVENVCGECWLVHGGECID